MMEHTVSAFLQAQMLPRGSRITAAVSGGADSMALLTVLMQLRDSFGYSLSAAHFNHGLRGDEAARDEAFVRQWCEKQNIPLSVESGDVRGYAAQHGQSIEEAARTLRYAFFDRLDTDYIATAHTADDNAETLLLHLLRGTGPRGLCGIPARRGRYLRPLLNVSREEIDRYLSEHGIPHIEDSSNGADDCVRNRLRHQVMPLLLRENPRFLSAVGRTAALQTEEDAFLSALAEQAAASCRKEDGYDCTKLRALPPVLLRRVLLGELRSQAVEDPSAGFIEALTRLIGSEDPSASVSLPGGLQALRQYDLLRFSRQAVQSFAPVTLSVPGTAELPELGLQVTCYVTDASELPQKTVDTTVLRYDKITGTVLLRPRRSGDTILLPGGTRTLKKWMIDRKLPARMRDSIPIVELSGQVAAVGTLAVSRSFLPADAEKALVIRFQRRP